ncbi:MAG: S1-like domain-containing RNA-binding protein [Anaeroplasma sp.]
MIEIGYYTKLKIVRISDLGYMLSDGKNDILLHFKESKSEHKIDEEIMVFIYADKLKRPTATESIPTCTIDDVGFSTVVESLSGVGIFVNINTPKDVLISKDFLPYDEKLWPICGDKVLIRLKNKHNSLVGKPLNKYDIIGLHQKVNYLERERVNGIVCRITDAGIGIVTLDKMYVFVPRVQLRGTYRMGQEVSVYITKALDEEYYGMLNEQKEEQMNVDRDIIINYLKNNNGKIKLTAKSSAEEVESVLKMSRKAFKRAYGGLYKDKIIDFDNDYTYLK